MAAQFMPAEAGAAPIQLIQALLMLEVLAAHPIPILLVP